MSGFRLEGCVWELTLACCFGCRYCGSAGGRARADELSTAECLDAAEQLADRRWVPGFGERAPRGFSGADNPGPGCGPW